MNNDFIKKIEKYLIKRNLYNKDALLKNYYFRVNEKSFSIEDHIKALIYSQLSNQRSWVGIESNIGKINEIFFNYDKKELLSKEGDYFVDKLKSIKCGNRSITKQMKNLKENITTLEMISEDFGSIDDFFNYYEFPLKAAKLLSNSKSKYKLKQVGIALALEYMRNVGIDVAKPDTHIRRILGSKRLNLCNNEIAKEDEAIEKIKDIAVACEMTQIEVDYLLWCYCADGKGNICTQIPNCNECVIKNACNYN